MQNNVSCSEICVTESNLDLFFFEKKKASEMLNVMLLHSV
ncbi:hypothetical protein THF5H11_30120 [Vibrio jasicida]|uniref:Uncharacterized protein n=1 Tax=Vibrio jasicida TaxID=766224 RepID=A0AAU9QX51_9VIBR|nr:hypothetical protein THF5H11_30120 [Vibrio jasicida]CAH1603017.1 hypothetical protein THF1C08_90119 [Vibrio jasicida]CAH1603737.1 hypothetical protein THF1A12_80115 [Vibrio jasicida]CAH1605062.1 hypothetical protein THF5G08_110111 [Vibrio jasicida]